MVGNISLITDKIITYFAVNFKFQDCNRPKLAPLLSCVELPPLPLSMLKPSLFFAYYRSFKAILLTFAMSQEEIGYAKL